MKCVCGYEYRKDEYSWVDDEYVELPDIGDEKFRKIRSIFQLEGDDFYRNNHEDVTLYMCPKCRTVKVGES